MPGLYREEVARLAGVFIAYYVRPERAHPRALAMLDTIGDHAAVLLGRRNDALAWTPTDHALLAPHLPFDVSDPRTRLSLPRLLLLDPHVRGAYAHWQAEAQADVAHLRRISATYPDGARLAELVGGCPRVLEQHRPRKAAGFN